MREEYDFTTATTNPYAKRLRKPVTIRLDVDTIAYFKAQAASTGIPYQTLINLYLAECAANQRRPALAWT
ncbi:MAG: BrnA antitoxin family protein [Bifidobacteriaceae bacterium]|jgi:predicted DNA binding CopG/RHH family protein|nr:BrnA antitoxin family protein [Bifidobacteriaceae bacterium]